MNWTRKAVEDLQKAAADVKEARARASPQEEVRHVRQASCDLSRDYNERPSHRPLRTHHGGRLLRGRQGRREGHLRAHLPPAAGESQFLLASPACRRSSTICSISVSPPRDRLPPRACRSSARCRPGFFEYLRDFRFTGDLFAVPEGTPLFAGEPVLTIRAPIIEAQIPETYLLSAVAFQTLIAIQSGALRGGRRRAGRWSSSARAARTRPKPACWARAPPTSAAAPAPATRSPASATAFR